MRQAGVGMRLRAWVCLACGHPHQVRNDIWTCTGCGREVCRQCDKGLHFSCLHPGLTFPQEERLRTDLNRAWEDMRKACS